MCSRMIDEKRCPLEIIPLRNWTLRIRYYKEAKSCVLKGRCPRKPLICNVFVCCVCEILLCIELMKEDNILEKPEKIDSPSNSNWFSHIADPGHGTNGLLLCDFSDCVRKTMKSSEKLAFIHIYIFASNKHYRTMYIYVEFSKINIKLVLN